MPSVAPNPDKKAAHLTTVGRRQAAAIPDGPRYKVTKDSFIDNAYCVAGTEVGYLGLPGSALIPINAEAKKRKEQVAAIRKDPKLSDKPSEDGALSTRAQALKELSDEWNGVEALDAFAESEAD